MFFACRLFCCIGDLLLLCRTQCSGETWPLWFRLVLFYSTSERNVSAGFGNLIHLEIFLVSLSESIDFFEAGYVDHDRFATERS